MPSDPLSEAKRVYISGDHQEFRSLRTLLRKGLEAAGVTVLELTEPPSSYREVQEEILEGLSGTDAMIHLAGAAYGNQPTECPENLPRRSVSQMEYHLAKELGIPIHVLVGGDGFPGDPIQGEDQERRRLQVQHRQLVAGLAEQIPWVAYRPSPVENQLLADTFALRLEFDNLKRNLQSLGKKVENVDTRVGRHRRRAVRRTLLSTMGLVVLLVALSWNGCLSQPVAALLGEESVKALIRKVANQASATLQQEMLLTTARSSQADYRRTGEPWLAEKAAKEFAEALEKMDPATDPPSWAEVAENQALMLAEAGRKDQAEALFRRAIEVREKAQGSFHPALATALNRLGNTLYVMEKYAEAEPLYRRALEIRKKALGPDHPDVATTFNNLGNALRGMDRDAEAEPLYRRALDIREKALGPDHPDVAETLNSLGDAFYAMDRYAEAEPLYRRELEIREKALGPDHRDVAPTLSGLGLTLYQMGRYAEAEPLCRRALEIQEKALGFDDPQVARALCFIGLTLYQMDRYAEAEPLYRRALEIQEKALGPDHPDVAIPLSLLGNALCEMDRYAEAEHLCRRALEIQEKALGPDHPDVAKPLSLLGNALCGMDRYAEAEPLYRRALEIQEKALGPNHSDVATSARRLAHALAKTATGDEAVELAKRALALVAAATPPDLLLIGISRRTLAEALIARNGEGDIDAARREVDSSLSALRQHEADSGPVGQALTVSARIRIAQKDTTGAVADLREAVSILSQNKDKGWLRELLQASSDLVSVLRTSGDPAAISEAESRAQAWQAEFDALNPSAHPGS